MTTDNIVSAIIKSIFTFLLNQLASKSKEKKQFRKDTYINRPELDIIDFCDYTKTPGKGIDEKCDIDLFFALIKNVDYDKEKDKLSVNYFEDDINKDEWCCVIYKLKNAGHTDISRLEIVCNEKTDCSIFVANGNKMRTYFKNNLLNCYESYNKKIRVNGTIKIKFCYRSSMTINRPIGSFNSIILVDDNGNQWEQTLNTTKNQISGSMMTNSKELNRRKSTDDTIKIFKRSIYGR